MPKTAADLTPEEIEACRRVLRSRTEKAGRELEVRRARAWAVARRAADILRECFGAQRVVIFGSLVHEGCSPSGLMWTWQPGGYALRKHFWPLMYSRTLTMK